MKVTFPKDYKNFYTVAEVEAAKQIIREMKEDTSTAAEEAAAAIREALKNTGDCLDEVLKAEATICKNNRIWNQYGENTGMLDIMICGIAKTSLGYIDVEATLSDIWQIGSEGYEDRLRMYVRHFTRPRD